MKNWQFWTLLIVQILGFAIIIAITQGTNSLVPTIIDTNNKIGNIGVKIDSIGWKLDSISNSTNKLHNIEDYVHKIYREL